VLGLSGRGRKLGRFLGRGCRLNEGEDLVVLNKFVQEEQAGAGLEGEEVSSLVQTILIESEGSLQVLVKVLVSLIDYLLRILGHLIVEILHCRWYRQCIWVF
jgi:hypothetical protein